MTTTELAAFVVGIVYDCGVIHASESVFQVGRAREWTRALTAQVEQQEELVALTGRCLLHRALHAHPWTSPPSRRILPSGSD